jgi:glycerol-3-phosphate acyltransferase PlsX
MPLTVVLDCATDTAEAVEAAGIASLDLDVEVIAVGDEGDITTLLRNVAHDAESLRVVHAPDRLAAALPTRDAMARAPRSSISVGLELVARRPGSAFVSSGRPGVVVRESLDHLTALAGCHRPALAAVYPTYRTRGAVNDPFALLLDVGATFEADAADLVAFARMGAAYARLISVNDRPRVGLLSSTHSIDAAPERIREAHAVLSAGSGFEYIGAIRADQFTLGAADVVVTDGFSGDVLLRAVEGAAATAELLAERARDRWLGRVGMSLLGGGIRVLREIASWENYGGAPLLGVNRPVILTQSSATRRAFVNAMRLAAKIERLSVLDSVEAALAPQETE